MYRNYRNIRVMAAESGNRAADLYLDLSGQRRYLATLRLSAPLCRMLRKGIRIEELKRWNGRSFVPDCPARYIRKGKLKHSVDHVIRIVDDYMIYELQDGASGAAA